MQISLPYRTLGLTRYVAVCLAAAVLVISGSARAQAPSAGAASGGLSIEHEAPGCVAAEKYARLSACFRPEDALARGRIYFRPDGVGDWFYVEMTGQPPCLQGVLPRPKKDLQTIEYYVSGMDREFAEVRSGEHQVRVTEGDTCPGGALAPIVESSSVIIGSASGAAPAGFLTGGGISTGLILGVAGGAAAVATAVVVAGGGGEEPSPPPTTTTTTTTTSTTSTTTTTTTTTTTRPPPPTTTTTTQPACETDPPVVSIIFPSTGSLPGTSTEIRAFGDDGDGSGIKEVRFYYRYCDPPPGYPCGPENLIDVDDTGPTPYQVLWSFPLNCSSYNNEKWTIVVRAEDNCGNESSAFVDDLILGGRGCFRSNARISEGSTSTWVSELDVPGGQGQVVIDGAQAWFPGPGPVAHSASLSAGPHRVEAVLVDAGGEPGLWRFDLTTLGVAPGSLRVVAGEVVQIGPEQVSFQLAGQPGERVVFTLRTGRE